MVTPIGDNQDYDSGIHPDVTSIIFWRHSVGSFFKGNRFPNLMELFFDSKVLESLELECPSLVVLSCERSRLTELSLDCPLLESLGCSSNYLVELKLNCPSLTNLTCNNNQLTKLDLDGCPLLAGLSCWGNKLTDLNGLEFRSELKRLICSPELKESADILKTHLPELKVSYRVKI